MHQSLFLSALCLTLVGCTAKDPAPQATLAASTPAALATEWSRLNSDCRGGPGDDPATLAACADREQVGEQLTSAGWCYGRPGEPSFKNDWHPSEQGCDGAAPHQAKGAVDSTWYVVDWRRENCLTLRSSLGVDTPEDAAFVLSTATRPQSVVYGDAGVTALIGDPDGTAMGLARGIETCRAAAAMLRAE